MLIANHRCSILSLGFLGLLASVAVHSARSQEIYRLDNSNFTEYLNANNPTNGTYELIGDITLTGTQNPIGSLHPPLSLTLNGNGHVISGLNVITEEVRTPAGLFGFLVNSWVHNLFLNQPAVLSTGNGSPAGAVVGEMVNSTVTDVINHLGTIKTDGRVSGVSDRDIRYPSAGGLVGWARDRSRVENTLNTGTVRTSGTYGFAGGAVGEAVNSRVSGNLNTGTVRTSGYAAFAGGAVGYAWGNSRVSGNLNTGTVRTSGNLAFAGGAVGYAWNNPRVSGNLNTGTVGTNGQDAEAGGAVGAADDSMVSGNLNTGSVSTIEEDALAGGAVGSADNSSVSGNLNTGSVSTIEEGALAGGAVGKADNSMVSGNLNTGSVSTSGSNAYAGGAVGEAMGSSRVSGNLNLNDEAINAAQANKGSQTGKPPNNNAIPVPVNGLGVLNGTLWTAGNDGQFPMLKNINAAYQDLRRINNAWYGNNTFPIELSMFAPPRNDTSESLFNPGGWNVREGYLPFLKSMGRTRAQAAGIDCTRGGFACGCDFTDRSPGTIEHLLYDGQRYHAVVKTDSGLAYWTTYEKDGSLVPLGSCGVYEFTDPLLSGTDHVVEAVINRGDSIYLAFHAPETQPVNPMLAMLTLSNEQPSLAMALLMSPNDRVVSLSVDEPDVLVNTGQAVYRLSGDNGLTVSRGNHALRANETIQSVVGNNGDLYFLTHELDTGYRLRVVPAVGAFAALSQVG